MLTAMRAVDNILLDTDHEIWAVNAESIYHEEYVEDDQSLSPAANQTGDDAAAGSAAVRCLQGSSVTSFVRLEEGGDRVAETRATSDLEHLLPVLRCPASGAALDWDSRGMLHGGARRYPVVDGVPVSIAKELSLFDPDAIIARAQRDSESTARRLLRWRYIIPPRCRAVSDRMRTTGRFASCCNRPVSCMHASCECSLLEVAQSG